MKNQTSPDGYDSKSLFETATAVRKELDHMAGQDIASPIANIIGGIGPDRLFYLKTENIDRSDLNRFITHLADRNMMITWVNPTRYMIGMQHAG